MADPILVRELPAGDARGEVIELPMTAHDRRRVRRVVQAPDGTRLALELTTGTVLVPGQMLHHDGSRTYVVAAAPEEVIVARPRSLEEAARVGHLIGNLHRDVEASGDLVIALADAALANRLTRAGVPYAIERRAFQGKAPGDHAH
jgi:urease accessory protein